MGMKVTDSGAKPDGESRARRAQVLPMRCARLRYASAAAAASALSAAASIKLMDARASVPGQKHAR